MRIPKKDKKKHRFEVIWAFNYMKLTSHDKDI